METLFLVSAFTFLVVAIPFWFLPYITPKSIQFGVRIPREREGDSSIEEIRKMFHSYLLFGSILILALILLLPAYYGYFIFSLISMPVEIIYAYLVYYKAFSKLRSIKNIQGWYSDRTETVGSVYEAEAGLRKSISGFFFIIPALAVVAMTIYVGIITYPTLPSLIPTHFNASGQADKYSIKSIGSAFFSVFIQIGMTVGMYILGYIITRTRQEIDVSRPITSYEQQELFKWYTRDSLYLFTSVINVTMMFGSFSTWQLVSSSYQIILILLPTLLGTLVLIVVLFSFGQMGSRIKVPGSDTENTGLTNRNDDKDWKGGVINYNKDNPSILVGKRFGIGWTFNFARLGSWIILGILVALPIIIILLSHLIH